jgi:hypothetical protein
MFSAQKGQRKGDRVSFFLLAMKGGGGGGGGGEEEQDKIVNIWHRPPFNPGPSFSCQQGDSGEGGGGGILQWGKIQKGGARTDSWGGEVQKEKRTDSWVEGVTQRGQIPGELLKEESAVGM